MDSMTRRTRVAVVQEAPVAFDRERTLEKVRTLVANAAGKGADLILFPEAFVSGYPRGLISAPVSDRARPRAASFSAATGRARSTSPVRRPNSG